MNRDDLIAYLLHKLPESERDAFEDRWVEDPSLYQQLRDAEAELLDAYAKNSLSPADRERVAKYLLDSSVQRGKLLFCSNADRCLSGSRAPRDRVGLDRGLGDDRTAGWRGFVAGLAERCDAS